MQSLRVGGFFSYVTVNLIPAAPAVTPRGGRVGAVPRQSDGKTDTYPLISTGGPLEKQLFSLMTNEEMYQNS